MTKNKLPTLNLALVLSILAAMTALIAKLTLTSGALLPGIDGAYYWVQVRSLFNDATLAFEDLPLVFWIQSLIAFLVSDIEVGVRISDALLPTLSAIPIYLMLKNSKQVWLPACAILVALLHPVQLFFFTGDFIKNAAAMPLVFLLGWILHTWGDRKIMWSSLNLAATFSLLALTHFGAMLLSAMILVIWSVFYLRSRLLAFWVRIGAITLALSAVLFVALALIVPARFARLFEFVSQPETIFADPFWQLMLIVNPEPAIIFAMITGQLFSIALTFFLWKGRTKFNNASLALAASSLVTAFLLSSPFVGYEWASRLIALSWVPLLLAAMLIWQASDRVSAKVTIATFAISTLVLALVLFPAGAKRSAITDHEYTELIAASNDFKFPDKSIVVARHGLEYLIAWTMGTHVIQEESYQDEDLSDYSSVFLLTTESQVGYGGYGSYEGYGALNKPPTPSTKPPQGSKPDEKPPVEPKVDKSSGAGEVVYKKGKITITRLR